MDANTRIRLEGCEVDVAQCELVRDGQRHHLTTKEVEVVTYFARNPSRNISHEELLEQVWGHSRLASTQPVYSVVKRLRRKLDGHGPHRHLLTVHGVGYRFEPPRGDAPAAAATLPPPPAPPHQMRIASFVGREEELRRIEDAFEGGARVVSLVGPGGAGKTRTALELGARWAAQGRTLVACELASAVDEEGVLGAIAVALGARTNPEDDAEGFDPILRTLRARPVAALLLDNAEHVLDIVAPIVLRLAPVVPVLSTSRERLSMAAEHVVEIGALRADDGDRLFRERARAAGAQLDDDAVVTDIVERLDGLPLAIEIAAAHASTVSLAQTREDLDRQIHRILATRRGVPARHASLRASVSWSWDLLDARERRTLAECSVFRGGFTIDAAEAVIQSSTSVRQDVLALAERSLLRPLSGPGSSGRFALYQSVLELAAEHVDDREALELRHARWAGSLARESGALDDVPPPTAFAVLAPELESLSIAFRRMLATGARAHGDLVADLALAIDLVASRTRGEDAGGVLSSALAVADGERAVALRLALGRSLQYKGSRGLAFLEETCALAQRAGTELQALEAERLRAACLAATGEPGVALPLLEAALGRARAVDSAEGIVGRLALDLAEAHLGAGRVETARALAAEAAALLEARGDHCQAARAAGVSSHAHREKRETESALAALERARRLLEEAGDEVGLARLDLDRGMLFADLARSREAVEALEAAIAAHRRLGLVTGELRARDWLVLALLGLGRFEDALAEAREIAQLGSDLGRPFYEAERSFGATWLVTGRLEEADAAFGRALDVLEAGGEATVRAHVLSARALGRVLLGRLVDAEADLEESLALHEARGGAAARRHAAAELALVRELIAPREDTRAILDEAARELASPWERRHAAGRAAALEIVRARRANRPHAEIDALVARARAELLGTDAAPTDYFTRCTLLLIDHVSDAATPLDAAPVPS